jgi:hypothetical protein
MCELAPLVRSEPSRAEEESGGGLDFDPDRENELALPKLDDKPLNAESLPQFFDADSLLRHLRDGSSKPRLVTTADSGVQPGTVERTRLSVHNATSVAADGLLFSLLSADLPAGGCEEGADKGS